MTSLGTVILMLIREGHRILEKEMCRMEPVDLELWLIQHPDEYPVQYQLTQQQTTAPIWGDWN